MWSCWSNRATAHRAQQATVVQAPPAKGAGAGAPADRAERGAESHQQRADDQVNVRPPGVWPRQQRRQALRRLATMAFSDACHTSSYGIQRRCRACAVRGRFHRVKTAGSGRTGAAHDPAEAQRGRAVTAVSAARGRAVCFSAVWPPEVCGAVRSGNGDVVQWRVYISRPMAAAAARTLT
jgi:hypothetical protein